MYIFWFLHQTTTQTSTYRFAKSCISFDSYIKPQPRPRMWYKKHVVYLLIPTSNHNLSMVKLTNSLLYIFWFLHQTTTLTAVLSVISELYIFWFLHQTTTVTDLVRFPFRCISFDSYIKPQLASHCYKPYLVVYLLIPTSNHNCPLRGSIHCQLYIFWFLHQTTTWAQHNRRCDMLYIFWFLHQTTTYILILS